MAGGGSSGLTGHEVPGHGGWNEGPGEEHEPQPSSGETTTPPVISLNRIDIREKPVIDGTINTVVHALSAAPTTTNPQSRVTPSQSPRRQQASASPTHLPPPPPPHPGPFRDGAGGAPPPRAPHVRRGRGRRCLPGVTAGLVAAWYASNIGVLLLNKYLLSVYGFRYPVFLTACHMSACALLSTLAHAYAGAAPARRRSRGQLARVAVLGAVFCASVVAGNVSLRYLPVSFNQAVSATTPFFTAVLAYAVAARREACATYAALIPVVAGVVIATGSLQG
ncbi:probable sugar phosphate/phosphate translocator At3g11320 [Panicum virgatum]|uniref:probable sugar phosphate/phosphate translocator At3g11320 n=1 Tax=Panicum virgatum TaxID=38727 RepID=UPI0019D57782|nr:probable sugar phosphate/phosphate translocator At3g11320 [Panicum virgatum]